MIPTTSTKQLLEAYKEAVFDLGQQRKAEKIYQELRKRLGVEINYIRVAKEKMDNGGGPEQLRFEIDKSISNCV